jgi:DNA mismatch repair protein MutS2
MRIQGTFIEPGELFNLYRSLITTKDICRFFKKEEHIEKYPSLHAIANRVVLHSYVFDGIERILNKQGKIRDNASPELAHIRKEQASKQAAVSKLIHRIIGEAQREGWVDAETTLSVRDGRVVIPVPASFSEKLPVYPR